MFACPWAAAAAIVALAAGCSCEDGPATSAPDPEAEAELLRVEIGPAEPVRLPDPGPDAAWAVEGGAGNGTVVETAEGAWFVPPPADGTYVASARAGDVVRRRVEATVAGMPAASLEDLAFDDGGVSGRYAGVRFRATPDAEATFADEDGETLTVRVHAPARATATWRGREVDGDGPLDDAERAWLDALRESALAPALTYVPLDLACRPGARDVDPAAGAALLFPWQLMLKYGSGYPAATARAYAARSACAYFPDDANGADDANDADDAPGTPAAPWPTVLILGGDAPLPSALGHFPLDGRGAAEAPLAPEAVR